MAGRRFAKSSRSLRRRKQAGFRAHFVRNAIPLRTADGAEENGIGRKRLLHVVFGDRRAMRIIGAAADQAFVGDETGLHRLVHVSDDLADLAHGLGTDAVARQQEKIAHCHEILLRKKKLRFLRPRQRPFQGRERPNWYGFAA